MGEEAPNQQAMGDFGIPAGTDALLIKQTMRGCIQECLGCDAKNEYQISVHDWSMQAPNGFLQSGARDQKDVLYALEQSGCLMRMCCKDGRQMEMPVSAFGSGEKGAGGDVQVTLKKSLGFPVMFQVPVPNQSGEVTYVECPCCCLLPAFKAFDSNGTLFSETKYVCDLCLNVPKFDYVENGQVVYRLRPPTCCMGCCIQCECGSRGMCNVTTPFYFYDPSTGEMITDGQDKINGPQITQVWGGLAKECCSTADTFAVKFPAGASNARKAGLVGATLLIDFTWFEGHHDSGGAE